MKSYCVKLIGFIALILAGCATTENFEKALNSNIGVSESALVQKWGIPTGSYELDGVRYLTYAKYESGYVAGSPPIVRSTIVNGKVISSQSGGSQGYGYTNACKVIFTIKNKVVVDWKHEGNSCKSY